MKVKDKPKRVDAIAADAKSATAVTQRTGTAHPDIDKDSGFGSRVFWCDETGDFRAAISLGAIMDGHTLLCPSEELAYSIDAHSWLDIAEAHRLHNEIHRAVSSVQAILAVEFGEKFVVFEHGGRVCDSSMSACGTAFPHIHIVPAANIGLCDFLRSSVAPLYASLQEFPELKSFYAARRSVGEYLLVSDASGTTGVWSGRGRFFRSQMLRHALQRAAEFQVDNWQDSVREQYAVNLAAKLKTKR